MALSFYHNHRNLLDRWAVRMGENEWFFNQFKIPTISATGSEEVNGHSTVGTRYGLYYQVHREEIAEALGQAYDDVAELLGYYPRPTFIKDEVINLRRRRVWWDQDIVLKRRYIKRVGTYTYNSAEYTHYDPSDKPATESDIASTLYWQQIKLRSGSETVSARQVPGYRMAFVLPEGAPISIPELKEKYLVSLTGENPDNIGKYQFGSNAKEMLALPQMAPYIKKRDEDNPIFLDEEDTDINTDTHIPPGTGYVYLFTVPAWNLVNTKKRLEELVTGNTSAENCINYTQVDPPDTAVWGATGVDILNSAAIELSEREVEETGAVHLLSLPDNTSSRSDVVKTPVKAIILDEDKSRIRLKYEQLSNINQPYAISISYKSGLDLHRDGEMDPVLEQAIVILANTRLTTRHGSFPVSNRPSDRFHNQRQSIFDDRGRIRDPQLRNPLGNMRGHSEVWRMILAKADRLKGLAWDL